MIKTIIRRILFFPIWIIAFPFAWLSTPLTVKEYWEEIFIDQTDEDTDYERGLM